MTEPKTKPGTQSVTEFLNAVPDDQKRKDSKVLAAIMRRATGCKPVMWGGSIVGFDRYHYRYDSGREGEWPIVGFAPRKQALTVYIMPGFSQYAALLGKLGKHTTAKSCLYIKRLSDVDLTVLEKLIDTSVSEMRKRHPA